MDPISSRVSLTKICVCKLFGPRKWISEAEIAEHDRRTEMKRQIIRVEPLASLLECADQYGRPQW